MCAPEDVRVTLAAEGWNAAERGYAGVFRDLTAGEVAEFRRWAREHRAEKINPGLVHPVVIEELQRLHREEIADLRRAVERFEIEDE
jgi:hypothetical protein